MIFILLIRNFLITVSLSSWPKSKKTSETTWTSSLEDLKKETIRGIQPNLFIYIYIYKDRERERERERETM